MGYAEVTVKRFGNINAKGMKGIVHDFAVGASAIRTRVEHYLATQDGEGLPRTKIADWGPRVTYTIWTKSIAHPFVSYNQNPSARVITVGVRFSIPRETADIRDGRYGSAAP